jgi:REP element-mobilizing transposase RayT
VRARKRFLLTAWVFLPDHWHAILFPPFPLNVSAAIKSVKLRSTNLLGHFRDERVAQTSRFWKSAASLPELRNTAEFLGSETLRCKTIISCFLEKKVLEHLSAAA